MPVLKNARHEKFAQELAKGKTADEAYQLAGFKPNRGNASVLKQKESISNRVAEILKQAEENDRKANERVIEKLAITKERVAAELAKIAFLDIREAVRWGRSPVDTESENANPSGLGIYPVELVPSDQISDEAAAAVSEVSLTQNGVKIKMHDKRAALMDLAKLMGFVIEKNEVTGKDGGPIQTETRTWREVLRDEKRG
jgi:phage terminase small subunit